MEVTALLPQIHTELCLKRILQRVAVFSGFILILLAEQDWRSQDPEPL